MTRVLVWNIENFGLNKIFSTSLARTAGHGGLTDSQAAIQRLALVANVFGAAGADIIVIVELSSGDNWPNTLATQTSGMQALVYLQSLLNTPATMVPGGWNVVPPLYTGTGGRSETIGILYRRTNDAGTIFRYFTGPNIWTGGYLGQSEDPLAGVGALPYPGLPPAPMVGMDINAMLVPAGSGPVRAIPPNAQHNGGLNEDVVAARIAFQDGMGGWIDFAGLREPFMASFTEATPPPGNVVQRDLTIFAIHSPPQGLAATNYMVGLATIPDIVGPLGANETRIVGGDFNLNLLNPDGSPTAAYNPILAANYTALVSPSVGGAPANLDQYMGYFSTHIRGKVKTANSKFLWSDIGGAGLSYYPGYGYVGSNFVAAPFYAIDNIFVRPHRGPPYDYQTTILNPIVGTPLTAVAAPANNPPTGTIAMASQFMAAPVGWPLAPTSPDYPGIGTAGFLTSWQNYGRIRNTSDHLGVFAIV